MSDRVCSQRARDNDNDPQRLTEVQRTMKQPRTCLLALLGMALTSGLAALSVQSAPRPVTAYSVAVLRMQLDRDPVAWVGRPILVRGVLTGCLHLVCPGHEPYLPPSLVDEAPAGATDTLRVTWADADPAWAFLRHVPLLSALVPRPQAPHWDVVASYRVQIQALSARACLTRPCYEAVVLDTAR